MSACSARHLKRRTALLGRYGFLSTGCQQCWRKKITMSSSGTSPFKPRQYYSKQVDLSIASAAITTKSLRLVVVGIFILVGLAKVHFSMSVASRLSKNGQPDRAEISVKTAERDQNGRQQEHGRGRSPIPQPIQVVVRRSGKACTRLFPLQQLHAPGSLPLAK